MKKLKLDELNRLSADEFKSSEKTGIILLLDNVRSLHNVGSAFRTADAFRVEKIYLCGITGTPPNREINKTALGATESVEWEHRESSLELVRELKRAGYRIICLEQTSDSVKLNDFVPEKSQKYCLVFGNEVFGVGDEIVQESDLRLEIPQFGTKHSFNVSVSIGIVLWDFFVKTNP
jgi:tRNA G18 (ribose-2'-O)-methylase SpoU